MNILAPSSLDLLPDGAAVVTRDGRVMQLVRGSWLAPGDVWGYANHEVPLPAVLIYDPLKESP